MSKKLLELWQIAASDLNLQVCAGYVLQLASGSTLEPTLLVKQFGARKGMLVFTNYDEVAPHIDEIFKYGYGFSILDEPRQSEDYEREEYIELLSDWGWSKSDESKPSWLKPQTY